MKVLKWLGYSALCYCGIDVWGKAWELWAVQNPTAPAWWGILMAGIVILTLGAVFGLAYLSWEVLNQ